jgi:hypothetical protein
VSVTQSPFHTQMPNYHPITDQSYPHPHTGDFTFSREPSVLVPAEVAGAGDAAAEFFGYLERFRADTDRINAR